MGNIIKLLDGSDNQAFPVTITKAVYDTSNNDLDTILEGIRDSFGTPVAVGAASLMVDPTKIYVYVGNEAGYTNGNWYYYSNSSWQSGGVYNAVAVNTDTTLTVSGMAADAKKVGDNLNELKSETDYAVGSIVQNGYTEISESYINANTSKITSASSGSLLKILVFPCQPNTCYQIKKETATHMRVASGSVASPSSGTDCNMISNFTTASSAMVEGRTGESDTYLYVQLYTNDDTGLKTVDANIKSLIIKKVNVGFDKFENVTGDLLKSYTKLENMYIKPDTGKMTYNNSYQYRIVVVPAKPDTCYKIAKSTKTIMRVGSGDTASPTSGYQCSNWVVHSTASADPLYIRTEGGDSYLYIQLYGDSDTPSVLRSIEANIDALVISPIEEAVDIATNVDYTPYAMGAINQVARLGWFGNITGAAPEQSIASYIRAYQHFCRIMLCDVRLTADNKWVCWHEEDLSRCVRHTDGSTLSDAEKAYLIADMTLAELDQYDFGIYRGSQFAGTKILRLADFLNWCKLTNCIPFLEIKINLNSTQIADLVSLIKSYALQERIILGYYTQQYDASQYTDFINNIPTASMLMLNAASFSNNAFTIAQHYLDAGMKVYFGWAYPSGLTSSILETIREKDIGLWYSEIKSDDEMETFYNAGYCQYYTLISSSYVNVLKWLHDKVM